MRLVTIGVLLLSGCGKQDPLPNTVDIELAGARLRVEVAQTPMEQEQGLQGRQSLPARNGMLFVLDRRADVCVWMKNTHMPLSAGFFDEEKRLVSTVEMQADTLTQHCSKTKAKYILEAIPGWFSGKNGKMNILVK